MDLKAIEELIELVEADVGINGACKGEPDGDSVGWSGSPMEPLPMTFGHVRRAREALEQLKAASD